MATPALPPYANITGIFSVDDKHQSVTKDQYNGTARPGQLVVDTQDYTLYVSNALGMLNPLPTSTGNGVPGGANTQIQFYDTGGAFAGSAAFTFNKVSNVVSINNTLSLGNLSMTGTVNNTLLPGGNAVYNLGSATARWRDLYLSGTTIFLGTQSISSNATHVIMNNDLSANRGQFNQLSGNGFAVTQIQANNIVGNIPSANLANLANVANVAYSVTGANVIGNVSGANTSFTVVTPYQANITRVGTLTELTVNGFTDLGPVANVRVTGGSSGQFLQTDGTGALSWATLGGNSIANSTSNVAIPLGGGNVNTSVGGVANVFVVTAIGANLSGALATVGNVAAGNLNTAGRVTATGNISGGNLLTTGTVTATGNVIGGNITTTGRVTAQGQVSGTSLVTSGSLVVGAQATFSDVANITIPGGTSGQYLQTDGAGNVTWAAAAMSELGNGNSNVTIPVTDGDVVININSVPGVMVINEAGTSIAGNLDVSTGNIVTTNLTASDTVSATYLEASDTLTTANADVSGNLTVGGNTVLGDPSTITIPGGAAGQFLKTDGAGNLEWSVTASDSIANGSSNLSIPLFDGNVNMSVGGVANVLVVTNSGANSAGHLTAAGNITGLNLATAGNVNGLTFTAIGAITGDTVTAANVLATDLVVSGLTGLGDVGNLTVLGGTNGQVLSTDGLGVLAWIDAGGTSIGNGTSNVAIPVTDGPIQLSVGGNLGVLTVSGAAANLTGILGVTGNVESGGQVIATGNVSGANITTGGRVVATGNVIAGNVTTAGVVQATGNITGGNIVTAGTVQATGNIFGNNITAASNLSVGNNINTVNMIASGDISGNNATISSNLEVIGESILGDVGNVTITGGLPDQYLKTDGSGTLSWGTVSSDGIANGTSNITVPLAGGNVNTSVGGVANVFVVTTTGANAIGTFTATGNVAGGNLTTVGRVTATGNVAGGNLTTAGVVQATGNVRGANLLTAGEVVATGNVIGGNLTTAGVVQASGDVSGGNLTTLGNLTVGSVSTLGEVANVKILGGTLNQFLQTDGTGNLVWADTGSSSLANGTTSVAIPVINGNVNTSVGGVTNVLVVTSTGANIAGTMTATGNVRGGNLVTTGVAQVTGNVIGGNITTAGQVVATANVSGGNITTAGQVVATANVSGGNLTTAGEVTATGNITGGNLVTAGDVTTVTVTASGDITSTANVTGANLVTAGVADITGTATAGNLATAGTLTVDGVSTLGPVGNVKVTGGTTGQVLSTDGTGNLSFISVSTSSISNGTSNTRIATAGGNVTTSVGGNANILTVTGTGVNVAGTMNSTGALTVQANGAAITGNVNINGNLNVTGNVNAANVVNLVVDAPLIFMANANPGDLLDIGLVGEYNDGATKYSGIARNHNTGAWQVYTDLATKPVTTVDFAGSTLGDLVAGALSSDSLTVAGTTDLGAVSNVTITGGTLNQFLQTDGAGNLIWATPGSAAVANGTSELSIPAANGNVNVRVGGVANVFVVTTTGANILGTATATGNVTGGNITTAGRVTATGNVSGGNLITAGEVAATGNITGGNIITAGTATATGNVTGANLITAGDVTTVGVIASGNISGGNLAITGLTSLGNVGNVSITGGTVNQFLQTDGTGNLIWATPGAAAVANGTSELSIPVADGNVNIRVGGVANVVVATVTGANVTGTLTATGNVTGANINTAGRVVATGNVSGGNLTTAGVATITGTATAGNLATAGTLSVGGVSTLGAVANVKITGGTNLQYLQTDGTGNLAWASVASDGIANGTSNVSIPTADGEILISAAGVANVVAVSGAGANIEGNLTVAGNITSTLAITAMGNVTGGNITTAGVVAATGNVTGANITTAGRVVATGNVSGGNITTAGVVAATGNVTGANLTTAGNTTTANLTVSGKSQLGAVANVAITGGTVNQFLQTDGTGNLIWATPGSAAVANGTSELSIPVADGNINMTVGGVANVLVVTGTGANIAGTSTATGNVSGGNLVTAGVVAATGNVSGGNITTVGIVNATGNVNGANVTATANLVVGGRALITGNVSAGNVAASGLVSGGTLSTTGTLTVGGVSTLGPVGNVKVTGGTNLQFLQTDGTGNLSWATPGSGSLANGTSNVSIPVVDGDITISPSGTANVVVVNGAGMDVSGDATVSGTFQAGDLRTGTGGTLFVAAGATVGGQVTAASLTTVGNATIGGNLVANGKATFSSVANVSIPGGFSGQVLSTNGSGVLSWSSTTALVNGTSSTTQNTVSTNIAISGVTVASVTSTGLAITGVANVSGNVTGANLNTAGLLSVGGNANVSGTINMFGFRENVTTTTAPTTMAPNAAAGTVYRYTASSNFTFNGFTSPLAGQSMTVIIVQDGTGSRTMSSTMKFAGGIKTLSTAPGAVDMIGVMYDGVDYLASLVKNYS